MSGRFIAFVIYAFVVSVVVYLFSASKTYPHSWYDRDCCDDRDCRPAAPDEVQVNPTGYLVTVTIDGFTASKQFRKDESAVRMSQDGRYHVCVQRFGQSISFYCLYVPGGGV